MIKPKHLLFLLIASCASAFVQAQTLLFHTGDTTGFPYRIPAIASAPNGDLIALSDRRPCGSDIGYGRVDILGRISSDQGSTWSEPFNVLVGSGKGEDAGYGDACLVADRKRNELLLVCVSGDVPYWNSTLDHRQRMVSLHARYHKRLKQWVWDKQPTDLTGQIYDELLHRTIGALFMGSGRICQSSRVKVGRYYRLYASLCTHQGNFVIYSDDFGRQWHVLGHYSRSCAPKGDEPKCEELPDGSVLLSSRKAGGRFFNVFRYADVRTARGQWGQVVDSRTAPGGISNESSACNGEILILPVRRTADGRATHLALQSLPAGPNRTNVTIYFKELSTPDTYNTPLRFASNWNGRFQVSQTGSAYSTMVQQKNGRIAFYYEEEPQYYQMVYRELSIDEITQGLYRAE